MDKMKHPLALAASLSMRRSSRISVRWKTTSAQYVAARARDPIFEKLMNKYKHLNKVIAIQDLILANPTRPFVSLQFLYALSQKLHLNRGATSFLRRYPHIFHIFNHYTNTNPTQPSCKLTPTVLQISQQESDAINDSLPLVVDRLMRLLTMSASKSLPLRAIFKVWRELGLPDDFEDSVISRNPHIFQLVEADERQPNTHVLKLLDEMQPPPTASVEDWRVMECCREDCEVDRTEMLFSFKHSYPPGMKLSKDFRSRVKEWQRFPYTGPYEKATSNFSKKGQEKRALAIVHEFLSLTVEKMVEVEKISHYRKWFGIDLNMRDLVLDHPGIFYLSTKGKTHTIFLREAYERGRLIHPNPVYLARMKLLHLLLLGRRALLPEDSGLQNENQGLLSHPPPLPLLHLPGGRSYKESSFTEAGEDIVAVDSPVGRLGLSVCYDLRFPEIYQQLRFQHDSQILLVPSAFTKITGEAHWEILLRARAIETQCYVVASAQAGKHNEKRESYGETLIIDPWGTVVGRLPDRLSTGITVADIDFSLIDSVREKIPIAKQRKSIDFLKSAAL